MATSEHGVGFEPADRLAQDGDSVRRRFWIKFKKVMAQLPFAEDLLAAYYCAFDPATPVNGPFSADFRWATLPDVQTTPIQFTDGQSKVLGALWSFEGEAVTAERIMQRAGLESAKPSDLFKVKAKDKGKPGPAAQHAAYGALVVTQQRAGLYAMPCAAAGKEVAMT